MTILIIDDDSGMVEVLSAQMKGLGDVRRALNLEDALVQMHKLPPPDLVLLDLFLPHHDRHSTAEETLRHVQAFKNINPEAVVIVITGSNEERLEKIALEMGADSFLRKQNMATQKRLFQACFDAFVARGFSGQAILDRLNDLLTPKPETPPSLCS